MSDHVEYPDLSGVPDDVTPEEMARLILGRPIRRDGVDIKVDLNITDQMLENVLLDAMLADAGIELDDENDIYGDDE